MCCHEDDHPYKWWVSPHSKNIDYTLLLLNAQSTIVRDRNNWIFALARDSCNKEQASSLAMPPPSSWEDRTTEEEEPLPTDPMATLLSMMHAIEMNKGRRIAALGPHTGCSIRTSVHNGYENKWNEGHDWRIFIQENKCQKTKRATIMIKLCEYLSKIT